MRGLPTTIIVGEDEYAITNRADYRVILDVFSALNDEELDESQRLYAASLIFFEDLHRDNYYAFFKNDPEIYRQVITQMFAFINLFEEESNTPKPKLYDWEKDEQLIFSALNKVAGEEIRRLDLYIHWFTFMGYFSAIGEGTFATVVSIRSKIVHRRKLEKWEQQFKRENPNYFKWNYKSEKAISEQDDFLRAFNNNKLTSEQIAQRNGGE